MFTKITNFKTHYLTSPIGLDTAKPRFSWELECDNCDVKQISYRIIVKGFIDELFWDSGEVKTDENINIEYLGTPLNPDTEYTVALTVTTDKDVLEFTDTFRTGLLNTEFCDAKWIRPSAKASSPLLKKTFFTGKHIAYATAYVAARGFYELYLNGDKVSDRLLAPAAISQYTYPNDCFVEAYDITNLLTLDNNTVGLWMGRGFSKQHFNAYGWWYLGEPKIWFALSIVYQDGSYDRIVSDTDVLWKHSAVIDNTIYGGEIYDKSLETPDWCTPYAQLLGWEPCVEAPDIEGLQSRYSPHIKVLNVSKCTNIQVREDEETFCDFGVNGTGFVRIKVMGEPGTKVIIKHSEHVNDDGTLNFFTNRAAAATDIYILKGHEIEVYQPRFTFHCFRYAQITIEGVAQLISAEKVTIGIDLNCGSYFKCDDNLLNRMLKNAERSMVSNFHSYPSDTASRDERTPCNMDSFCYEELAINSYDMHKYYIDWLRNCKAITDKNGMNPLWHGNLITLTLRLYKYYGDLDIVEEMYPYMLGVIESNLGLYKKNGYEGIYGDWCTPNEEHTNDFKTSRKYGPETGIAVMVSQLHGLAEVAEKLGKTDDANRFKELEDYFRGELYSRFYDEKTGAFSDVVAPNLIALHFGAVKKKDEKKVYEFIKKHIKEVDHYHIKTGIFGTLSLIDVLSRDSEGLEILSRMLHNHDTGYARQIRVYDATCLMEQWFGLRGMCSMNHPMFGGIFADFYQVLAGITSIENAYKKIKIEPHLLPGMNEINCVYHSIRGKIGVFVRRIGKKVYTDVIIPPNTTALVITPSGKTYNLSGGKHMLE